MSRLTLTDARVRALKARKSAYQIHDLTLRGFGVRVLPSGAKRFYLHTQHRGQRNWNIVGDANAVSVAEAMNRWTPRPSRPSPRRCSGATPGCGSRRH